MVSSWIGCRVSTRRVGAALALGAAVLVASTAQAAGVEDTVGGTVALGRAANYARVNDFMATWQNPANLAIAPRGVGLELRVPIFNGCFDRARNTKSDADGDMKPGVTYGPNESFAKVCNDASPFPTGNVGVSVPVLESPTLGRLSIGAGIFSPAGVSSLSFGNDTLVTVYPGAETLPYTKTGKESPNRSLLLSRDVLSAFASLGFGWAPIEQLRFGATFGWGIADVKYKNVASLREGFGDQQVVNDVRVRDNFIPRVTASVAATPIESVDVMASFTYTGDIEADGYVDITANGIKNAPRKNCRDGDPGPHCRVDDVTLKVPYQRYEAVVGARYADRRVGREKTLDPLADEVWDVEINGFYANTGHVKDYALDLYDMNAANKPQIRFSTDPAATPLPLPARAALPHGWHDTFGVRLGGDYNVLENMLAVRAGASYETGGVPTKNMNIDYWPVQKIGAHLGLTYRIRKLDLHLAYAHLFNQTVDVAVGKGNINEVFALPGTGKKLGVNEGKFTSHQDIISVQANYRF